MATSNLTQLNNTLSAQAVQGSFDINAGNLQTASGLSLPEGLDALLQNALLPAPAVTGFALTVSGAAVQFTLSNNNQTLTVTNCTVNVLNLVNVPVTIIFTNDNGTLQFTLNMAPPDWSFGTSFPLIGGSIEGLLDFDSAHLIFSTTVQNGFVWETTETTDLAAGLNFAVGYNTGNLTLVKEFITWGDPSFTPPAINLTGSIQPPGPDAIAQIYPSIDVSASIAGNPTLNFPPGSATPFLKLSAPSVSLESSGYSLPNVFFNLQISIGTSSPIVLDVKAAVMKQSNLLRICVSASDKVGLEQIFDLIPGGQTIWATIPTFITDCLNSINFYFFSADFFLGQNKAITSLQSTIGSTSALNFFEIGSNYLFTIDTFVVNWTCLNPANSPQHFFNIAAQFQFPEVSDLVFNVSISTQNETVSGSCNGTVSLSGLIGDLNNFIHNSLGDQDVTIPVPFDVSLSDFQVFIDHKNKVFSFGATANAELKIMGQEILGVQNAQFTLKKTATSYDVTVTGILNLFGINFNVTADIATGSTPQTVISINMVNQTLGSLLDMLVKLVSRDAQAILPFPWSKLNDIKMDALVLTFTITSDRHEVSVTYSDDISLGFIDISSFTLTYEKQLTGANAGTKSTLVSLDCSFFGKSYGGASGNNAMAWDPVNGNPPAVPDKGTVLDIRYLGLGQHISFASAADTSTMQAILENLENIAVPPPRPLVPGLPATKAAAQPLSNIPALTFNGSSNWFIGADMTIMGAVSFAVIFNDPELYGLIISLSGPKVKSLAGLRFEILYRKINDTIGEYYTELKVPTAMRQIQMGEVSITLPVIGIAIYTNGNFEIDFGFPWNNDFSRSFGLQVLPFVGAGGFYFGVLDGATATQTPAITNGSFNPVIVFGFGLQVGLGKSVNEGILSADVEVDIGGIVQGVYANFEPDSKAIESATFFKLQGVVAISGVLSGSINFAIIQATVAVHVYAEARIVYEVHQAIQLGLDVGVSVEVAVKILFIKIHFSFSATISESYTIGSATPTPWVLAANQPSGAGGGQQSSLNNRMQSARGAARPHEGRALSSLSETSSSFPAPHGANASFLPDFMASRASVVSLSESPAKVFDSSSINWQASANAYFTTPPQLELDFVPTPTALNPATGGGNTVDLVAMLYIENSIDGGGAGSSFNLLLEAILAWALKSGAISGFSGLTQAGASTTDIAYEQLESLHQAIINGPDPGYNDITSFLSQNFSALNITAFNGTSPADKSSAVFPMIPELILNSVTTGGTGSTTQITNFKTQQPIDAAYVKNITSYLQSLNIFTADAETVTFAGTESLPTMVFNDYFHLLIRAVVQAAKNALSLFNYEITDTTTTPLTTQLSALGVDTTNAGKPSFVAFAHANKGVSLTANQIVTMSGLDVVIQTNQKCLNDIANTLMGTATPNAAFVESLLSSNLFTEQSVQKGAQLNLSTFSYLVPDNSVATVNALFGAQATVTVISSPIPGAPAGNYNPYTTLLFKGGSFTTTTNINTLSLAAYSVGSTPALIRGKNMTALGSYTDNATLPEGMSLQLPDINYQVPPDTQYYLSRYFGVNETSVTGTFSKGETVAISNISQALNGYLNLAQLGQYLQIADVSTLASTLAGLPVIAPGAVFTAPDFSYTTASGDTPEGIAQQFDVNLDELIFTNLQVFYPASTTVLIPKATVSVEALLDTLKNAEDPGHQKIPFNNVAGQVSRFLLHGLRLPDPGQTIINSDGSVNVSATTSGLYDLLGQQFAPGAATAVSLTDPGSNSWISFEGGTASTPITTGSLATGISALQSAVTTFNFNFQAYPLYRTSIPRYTLQHQISWAPPQPPGWMGTPAITSLTALPALWLFPEDLMKKLTAVSPITLSLHTGSRDVTGMSSMTCSAVDGYRWGTLLNLKVRQVKSSASASGNLSYIYEVEGLKSENERHTLTALIQAYKADSKQPEVYFLFDGTQGGMISDKLTAAPGDGDEVRMVKSNLSTIIPTTEDITGVEAGITSNPLTFLELIWEGSLLKNGGFYLQYQNAQGKGLPAYLFSQGPEANVKILVLCPTDMTQVSNYHNTVVLQSPVDLSRNVLFAQADDLTDYRCVMKPGNLGLKITCDAPANDAQIPLMYNLLTAKVNGNSYFNESIFAMPAGPVNQPGGNAATWEFHQLLPVSKIAINSGVTPTPGFPNPLDSPYNAVGATLLMDFYFQDIFGNQAATQKQSLPGQYQSIGYFDQIISLSRWPGIAASFDFSMNGTNPQLNVYLHFDVNRYLPLGQVSLNDCVNKALKDQILISTIYYQLSGPGVSFDLQTSMGSVAAVSSAVAQAQQLAGQMYQFAATVHLLTAPVVKPSTTTTLESIAGTYHLSVDELSTANNALKSIFSATQINKPLYYTVKYGDSINSICNAANNNTAEPILPPLDPATWAATLAGLPNLLRAGTVLTIDASTVYTIQPGDTINSIATKFAAITSVSATTIIAGNLAVSNIFSDSIQVLLSTSATTLPVLPSTSPAVTATSLNDIAKAWGVTPGQLAQANALTPLNASITIPNAYSLPSLPETNNYLVYTVNTNQSLTAIAANQNYSVEDLFHANQGLLGVMNLTAIALTNYPGVTYTPDANDTLLTVFNYFQGQVDGLTSEIFINQVQALSIFSKNAVILLPPVQVELNTVVTPGYTAQLFEISASLAISRESSLVEASLPSGLSGVQSVTSTLIPHSVAGASNDVSLKSFAQNFESTFAHVKVGVHRKKNGQTGKNQHLWAVPLAAAQNAPDNTLAYYLDDATATYFAPAPLANQRVRREQVPVYPYRSGIGISTSSLPVNFVNVDMDQWAATFLSALGKFTSAEFSVPASDLNNTAFAQLMQAKQSIAGTIANSVIPIMNVAPAGSSLSAAQESLNERLLQDVAVAYDVESIVQLEVDVKNSSYDAENAPRLTGKPVMKSYIIQGNDTLQRIAAGAFAMPVSIDYLGTVLADVPGLIQSYALSPASFKNIGSLTSQDSANIFDQLVKNGILYQNGLLKITVKSNTPLSLNAVYEAHKQDIIEYLISTQTNQASSAMTYNSNVVIPSPESTLSSIATALNYGSLSSFIEAISTLSILAPKALNFAWNSSPCTPDDTLLSLAVRFNDDLYTIVLANLENTGLLQAQTITIQNTKHSITTGESLSKLLDAIDLSAEDFLAQNIQNSPAAQALAKLPGLFATEGAGNGMAGILRQQQALNLSTAEVALMQSDSYLTFLLEKTGTQDSGVGENAFIDFTYKVNAINMESGEETLPGFEDYSHLSFVLPFKSNQDISLEIPIPLREAPQPPTLISQSPVLNIESTNLETLQQWNYQIEFDQYEQSQDEIEVSFSLNIDNDQNSGSNPPDKSSTDLFCALANFISLWPYLEADLSSLPHLCESLPLDPNTQKGMVIAIEAFSNLAGNVANAWTTWTEDKASINQGSTTSPNEYQCLIQEFADENGYFGVHIRSLNNNLPQNALPTLEVVDADGNPWVYSISEPSVENGLTTFTYLSFKNSSVQSTPLLYETAKESVKRIVQLQNLNILQVSKVWGELAMSRNQDLINGQTTNPDFVYVTPWVKFINPCVPFIDSGSPVDISTLTGPDSSNSLAGYLSNLFYDLLDLNNPPSGNAVFPLTVSCHYLFAVANNNSDTLYASTPVFMHPLYDFTPDDYKINATGPQSYVQLMASAIQDWYTARQQNTPAASAKYQISITLLTNESQPRPIFELTNLFLNLSKIE